MHAPVLLESVVRELHLAELPLFNPALRAPGRLAGLVSWLHRNLPGDGAPVIKREDAAVATAAIALSRVLTVFYDNKSFVVTVSVVLPDAQLAADVVNAIMREQVSRHAELRLSANAAANAALMHRVEDVRAQVDRLDGQLSDLRARIGLINLPAGSMAQQRMSELATAASRATDDRLHAESLLQQATAMLDAGRADELADVLASPTVARLREREATAAERVAELSAAYGPDYPPRRAAESDLSRARSAVADEAARQVQALRAAFAAARSQEASARAALGQAGAGASEVSLLQSQMAQLQEEVTSRRALYQTLLERASQTKVEPETASESPGVHIGSLAVVPVQPSAPHPRAAALFGGLAGLALGCGLALLGGAAPRFSGAGELAALTDVPMLAVGPVLPRRLLGQADLMDSRQEEVLAFLRLRLRQSMGQMGLEVRSVAFAGASGAAPVHAAAFARNAARSGARVLLIGAAEPASKLSLAAPPGGFAPSWRDVVAESRTANVSVLAAAPYLAGPGSGWNMDRLRHVLREAADEYNLVVLASADDAQSVQTSQLAELASYTVLVVDLVRSRRAAIFQWIEHLRFVGPRLGLLVFTRHRRRALVPQRPSAIQSHA